MYLYFIVFISSHNTYNQCCGYVFGRPGSGSISQRNRSGSFCHQAKLVTKTLISIVLWLLLNFLSLKNYVNVPLKSNKQKNFFKKLVLLLASWKSMTKIAGSGSNTQRHGSGSETKMSPIRNSAYTNWASLLLEKVFHVKLYIVFQEARSFFFRSHTTRAT